MARKNYFVIVHAKTGEMLLDCGRLPIFWSRKAAKCVADKYHNNVVKPVNIIELERILTQPTTHAH